MILFTSAVFLQKHRLQRQSINQRVRRWRWVIAPPDAISVVTSGKWSRTQRENNWHPTTEQSLWLEKWRAETFWKYKRNQVLSLCLYVPDLPGSKHELKVRSFWQLFYCLVQYCAVYWTLWLWSTFACICPNLQIINEASTPVFPNRGTAAAP